MYDAGTASKSDLATHVLQRVNGKARIRFGKTDGRTRLSDLYQAGAAKIRFPKVYDAPPTAVAINTAGGLTGGDRMSLEIKAGENTHAIVTSQTAERAYRSAAGSAEVSCQFALEAGAFLEWLPQETILFEASSLKRRMSAELEAESRLLMLETVVLGRKAMGERIGSVLFRDSWRIRREGRLVFGDDIRFDGDPSRFLGGRATGRGGLAVATLVDCAPDAEDRLASARALLEGLGSRETQAAVSAWNGLLAARFVSEDGYRLRSALMQFLIGYRGTQLPRVWHC